MKAAALSHNLGPARGAVVADLASRGPDANRFGAALRRASSDATALRQAATRLVSTALVQPLLESLRQSPFNDEGPFAPGAAERRFGPLLDTAIADRVTASSRFGLVDAIVARLDPAATGAQRPAWEVTA
jgi:Rod binding domain-containing protein